MYFYMKTADDSPHLIPEERRVFVLCSTVVPVKLGVLFSEAVLLKKKKLRFNYLRSSQHGLKKYIKLIYSTSFLCALLLTNIPVA